MRKELRNKAIHLRTVDRLSYSAIKTRLNVSKSTLSYWLKDFPLADEEILKLRRAGWSKGEASRERYRASMRRLREEKSQEYFDHYKTIFNKLGEDSLFALGIMLYIAEGAKKKEGQIVLSNSDPAIVRFFVFWACKFLGVKIRQIKVQLHLYDNMDLKTVSKYWCRELGILESQLYKPTVRKVNQGSYQYLEPYRKGTCMVYIFGSKIRQKVFSAMKALLDNYENMRV